MDHGLRQRPVEVGRRLAVDRVVDLVQGRLVLRGGPGPRAASADRGGDRGPRPGGPGGPYSGGGPGGGPRPGGKPFNNPFAALLGSGAPGGDAGASKPKR